MRETRTKLKRILLPWRKYKEWKEHRETAKKVADILLGHTDFDEEYLKSLGEDYLKADILFALLKMEKTSQRRKMNENLLKLKRLGHPVGKILDELEDYIESKSDVSSPEILMTSGAGFWIYSVIHHSTAKENETYLFDALAAFLSLLGGAMATRRGKWQVLSERLDRLREATKL